MRGDGALEERRLHRDICQLRDCRDLALGLELSAELHFSFQPKFLVASLGTARLLPQMICTLGNRSGIKCFNSIQITGILHHNYSVSS